MRDNQSWVPRTRFLSLVAKYFEASAKDILARDILCRSRMAGDEDDNEVDRSGAREPQSVHDLPKTLRCDWGERGWSDGGDYSTECGHRQVVPKCQNVQLFLAQTENCLSSSKFMERLRTKVTPRK